ncbi:MAG TPA: TonB-dependent receptor, partial [Candidatus Cybelea sp.]
QELQVYTGGGPGSVASNGTAGFINEVIKTGTFPGFATANLGVGWPAYYHQAMVEVGGSTPDRTFSYYVGLLGYNQSYRFIDNSNGGGYSVPGGIFSGNTAGYGIGYGEGSDQFYNVAFACIFGTCQGVKPVCPLFGAKFKFPDQGCWQFSSGTQGDPLMVSDRESVVNVHLGIPRANGLRDDVQLLWSGSALNNYGYNSPSDAGPGVNQLIYSLYNTKYAPPVCGNEPLATWGAYSSPVVVLSGYGCTSPSGSAQQIYSFLQSNQFFFQRYGYGSGPYKCSENPLACGPTYLGYADSVAYDLPFGTPIASSAANFKTPSPYFAPATPPHPFGGPIPLDDNSLDVSRNGVGIAKLQYTHSLSQSAFVRAYGYTFYSDWTLAAPTFAATGELVGNFPGSAQYLVASHTAGGALSFEDQINPQNLLSLDGNYTTAGVLRVLNASAYGIGSFIGNTLISGSPVGYMAKKGSGYACYDPTTGLPEICLNSSYYDVTTKGNVNPTWVGGAANGPPGWPNSFAQPGSPAAKAGATWDTLWTSNLSGSYNTVRPRFTNAALQDQFRPNDKLMINASIRYDDFTYDLPDSLTAATQFYANMTANYTCVLAATDQVLTQKLPAGTPPPPGVQYILGDCDQAVAQLRPGAPHAGWVHPNGTVQDGVQAPNFTASSPSSYTLNYWQPRFSGTYTLNPETVIRASAGRFTQPPISASLQYLSLTGDETSVWNNSMNLGFYSPFHPIPGVSSAQYDLSWEQRLKGTDMSFKLTPFYTWVTDWQQQSFVGAGFVTQVPVGVNRAKGVEFQFLKGDLTKNGWSGMLAFTYTDSKVRFENIPLLTGGVLPNQMIALNTAIAQYNELTKAGGGHPCYQAGKGVPCSTPNGKVYDTILNPYYGRPEQPLLDENGWYTASSLQTAPNLSGALGGYISPYVGALIANWRDNKLTITPSLNFQTGGFYGSPLDTQGLDPRTCQLNSAATGITKVSPKTNPLQCNYLYLTSVGAGSFAYLYVPNPQTGAFLFSNYQQPSSLVGDLQASYDVSPRLRLTVLATTLFHQCFGGTRAPWSAAYPPGYVICGYSPAGGALNNSLYPSNFYNGTGINDYKANGARSPWTQSYLPSTFNNGAIGESVAPISIYFNAQLRI